MTKINLFFINLLLLFSLCGNAQLLEDDNNILFMKANALFESDRYDESVRLYNRILKDAPLFSRALFMRGKAKFALGAFKGAKSDMLDYIEQRGISKEVIELLANTELNLENDKNALTYLNILVKLKPFEGKYFAKAAEIEYENGNKNRACEYWIHAAKLGDADGAKQARLKCAFDESIHLPSRPNPQSINDEEEEIVEREIPIDKTVLDTANIQSQAPEIIDVAVHTTSPDVDMNASQNVEVDDELTLTLNSGLGERKIDDLPNILMLSDKSGKVVIDLCVNGDGSIESAQLNKKLSTIFRSSLSSLAIRKAKKMRFVPSLVDQQCGLLIFNIDTKG